MQYWILKIIKIKKIINLFSVNFSALCLPYRIIRKDMFLLLIIGRNELFLKSKEKFYLRRLNIHSYVCNDAI